MIMVQSKILVVDDELFFRNLYGDLLQQDRYSVTLCESGEEAIRLLGEEAFDLVVTDMVMPGMGGLDILRAARATSNPADVILVTGHASLETAIDALKNGARDYLVKPFDPAELQHLVGNCLEQRKLLTENDKLRRQVQLFMSTQGLSSLLDFDKLLPQAVSILMREASAGVGLSFTLSKDGFPVLFAVNGVSEIEADRLASALVPQLEKLDGEGNAASGRRFVRFDVSGRILWGFALTHEDGISGAILLGDLPDAGALLSSPDLRYVCDQVLLAFHNACRYQSAQQLMYTDDLTGLYNHRYMKVALSHEIKRSQRYGLMFSLVFLDLDHFKNINDTHGHLAGSAALKEVGSLLRDCVRTVDTLFRYGGDEFAILLVEADAAGARRVAERIRKTVEGHTFLDDQGIPSYMTVTAGYATYPVDASDQEMLLHLADKAMYSGKGQRNIIHGTADLPEN